MRVFVAGASGALGSRLVPQLIDAGHEVVGTHHAPPGSELLRTLGAEPLMVDLLDPRAVRKAVLESDPDAIVHQATALANMEFGRSLDKTFAKTNRLRIDGTDALLAAAREAGVRRFVAQSFASYRYAREGGPVKTEEDPLDPTPPANAHESYGAMSYLEDDGPAIYNIVDDEPAPVREWLPVLAEALGAKPPRHFSRWLARIFGGEAAVMMGTEARGASNANAKRELGFIPRYPTWRKGFPATYTAIAVAAGREARATARTRHSPS